MLNGLNMGRIKDLKENIERNDEEQAEYISLIADICIELYELADNDTMFEDANERNEELEGQLREAAQTICDNEELMAEYLDTMTHQTETIHRLNVENDRLTDSEKEYSALKKQLISFRNVTGWVK